MAKKNPTHVSDEEIRQQVVILNAALQLDQEETGEQTHTVSQRGSEREKKEDFLFYLLAAVSDGLAVPVVDLLDVAEDDLVFASHVLGDPSDLQPGHEALRHRFSNFN